MEEPKGIDIVYKWPGRYLSIAVLDKIPKSGQEVICGFCGDKGIYQEDNGVLLGQTNTGKWAIDTWSCPKCVERYKVKRKVRAKRAKAAKI